MLNFDLKSNIVMLHGRPPFGNRENEIHAIRFHFIVISFKIRLKSIGSKSRALNE